MSSSTKLSWECGPMHLLFIPTEDPDTHISNSWTTVTAELATIHNIFIRALNSIYLQAGSIPLSEYTNFTTYCITIYRCLIAHYAPSQITVFSKLTGLTSESILFDAPLRAWGNWLESCEKRRNNFSAVMCVNLMGDFLPALQTHFSAMPVRLARQTCGDFERDELMKEHRDVVFGAMSKTKEIPVLVMNHDSAFGGGQSFPRGTWGVKRWAMRNVWARKEAEWWKFGTVGWDGKKREVRFIDQEQKFLVMNMENAS